MMACADQWLQISIIYSLSFSHCSPDGSGQLEGGNTGRFYLILKGLFSKHLVATSKKADLCC